MELMTENGISKVSTEAKNWKSAFLNSKTIVAPDLTV
jgi:hypothetical protein